MLKKNLKQLFLLLSFVAVSALLFNLYSSYKFRNNPISDKIKTKIEHKEYDLYQLAMQHYNITQRVPIIITDKIPSKLFGLASLDKEKNVKIYLNKKRMKESLDYMIEDVLPHEYAHAVIFLQGIYSPENGGHTKEWQDACIKLGGIKCERFVNHDDIVFGKIF